MQALQKVGGPLGTAILGSVLSATYIASLNLTGLPPTIVQVVKEGLFSGIAVATRLGSPELLASVQSAFVDGMNAAMRVGAGIAVVGLVLTLIFLPNRPRAAQETTTMSQGRAPGDSPADTVKSAYEQSVTRR
jgi:hypothetical protein